jgi:hypothetical protein
MYFFSELIKYIFNNFKGEKILIKRESVHDDIFVRYFAKGESIYRRIHGRYAT